MPYILSLDGWSWNQIEFEQTLFCMFVAWLITLSAVELGTFQRMDSLPSSSLPSVMVSHTSKSRIICTKTLMPCLVIRHIDWHGQHNHPDTHTCTLGRHLSGHLSVRWLSAPWQPSVHLHSNGELKCSVPVHAAPVYGTMQNQSACVVSFVPACSTWALVSIRNAECFMNIVCFTPVH